MKHIALFCTLLIYSSAVWAGSNVIYLGMVEDVPGVYVGESHSTKVRVLFSYQNNHWKAFKSDCEDSACLTKITSSFPKKLTWFIGLHGHLLGKVVARTPKKFNFYSDIGLQDIIKGHAPVVGKASDEYSG